MSARVFLPGSFLAEIETKKGGERGEKSFFGVISFHGMLFMDFLFLSLFSLAFTTSFLWKKRHPNDSLHFFVPLFQIFDAYCVFASRDKKTLERQKLNTRNLRFPFFS